MRTLEILMVLLIEFLRPAIVFIAIALTLKFAVWILGGAGTLEGYELALVIGLYALSYLERMFSRNGRIDALEKQTDNLISAVVALQHIVIGDQEKPRKDPPFGII